ncbi:tRNAHis guanylyltransferase-domain-containing protein [Phaeosphaeriaceae sp. PMI808]|nr:tRNAHis guanylyltransferase-domain-containing protein [Phaeosphaeriaceae sp. PMI808]
MANSKYEYVRLFEQPDNLLANTWIVVRIDGRGFSKLTTKYKFVKPNDRNALDLMNAAAKAVMKELPDLVLAYGNSDEFSFVFHKDCALFERRASKLTTTITSTFTSHYVFLWSQYFPDKPLTPPLPSFDGRAVCYPSDANLRDYMSWRQVDCHINNLYNTTFWALVQQGGMDPREAEKKLSGTVSSDKNEILFKEFGINYNNEPECFKKGTVLYRDFYSTSATKRTLSAGQPRELITAIAAPQPKRVPARHSTRVIENAISFPQEQVASPVTTERRSTFLSSASTSSPPSSPGGTNTMSKPTLPNPLRSNPVSPQSSTYPPVVTMPLSPPSTLVSPMGNMYITSGSVKQPLPNLTPLPLSPPILKPSTKPPLSLNAPNPTTRTNFSPTFPSYEFPSAYPIQGYNHASPPTPNRQVSHSASASMTLTSLTNPPPHRLKQRSPSQPHLPSYFSTGTTQQPPVIPLRISSIPMNNKTRKLSLQPHRSLSTLKPRNNDEKEIIFTPAHFAGSTTPRRVSPPLRTNKALPSPPLNAEEEMRTRERVMGSSSPESPIHTKARDSPPRRASDVHKRSGQMWSDSTHNDEIGHPGIAELPATSVAGSSSTPRTRSTSLSATLTRPLQAPDVQALSIATSQHSRTIDQDIQPTAPLKDSPRSKAKRFPNSPGFPPHAANTASHRGKVGVTESGSWAAGTQADEGRPVHVSRTQRDKERKKRSKAKIVMEHVDVIKDEFWIKRPWIMSGKAG